MLFCRRVKMEILKLLKVSTLSYLVFLILIVLTKTQNSVTTTTGDHLKEIIQNHTVLIEEQTESKHDAITNVPAEQIGLNDAELTKKAIRFGCRKQVPIFSLKKGRRIKPQNTESPYRIIVEPQTVKAGDQVKGTHHENIPIKF